jgi:NAD(P)-dependent dehydrogenase (short-subunit alcohol dehydrogenase family)
MTLSLFDLSDRVAVVVGGTTGIGRSIALGLARAGAHVVSSSRDEASCRAVADEIRSIGRRTLIQTSDVGKKASLEALRARTFDEFGQIDILVNCAGRMKRNPSLDVTEEEWCGIIDTNLNGTFRSCQVFGKSFIERGKGVIINVASLTSYVGFLEVAAYTSSKSGVAGLTRALAVEWATHGVRVNAIAPGIFPTALNEKLLRGTERGSELLLRTPMKRFGDAAELAGTAVFLASDASSFVTGQLIAVDGGFLASGVNQ